MHSDERLTLETSVFESFTMANFTFSNLRLIIYFSVSGHWQVLVGHCPMPSNYLQLCSELFFKA